jgi:RNA-directed DNA polymerase
MKQKGYRMVRYADDFVVLCQSREEAEAALSQVKAWVESNGLRLSDDKTQVGDCQQPGQGFDFLGYHFELGRRWARKKSYKALQDRIRMRTKRTRGDSLAKIIADLNPTLRGWFNYFKHAHPNTFKWMDSFVRRRLRAVLRKQEKRPGMGVCREDHQRWPNTFFAAQGLFTMTAAWKLASQSRCGNHRLESRVRENRTHGSEGGDAESRFRPLSDFQVCEKFAQQAVEMIEVIQRIGIAG